MWSSRKDPRETQQLTLMERRIVNLFPCYVFTSDLLDWDKTSDSIRTRWHFCHNERKLSRQPPSLFRSVLQATQYLDRLMHIFVGLFRSHTQDTDLTPAGTLCLQSDGTIIGLRVSVQHRFISCLKLVQITDDKRCLMTQFVLPLSFRLQCVCVCVCVWKIAFIRIHLYLMSADCCSEIFCLLTFDFRTNVPISEVLQLIVFVL